MARGDVTPSRIESMLHRTFLDALLAAPLPVKLAAGLALVLAGVLVALLEVRVMRWLADVAARSRFRWDGVLVGALARPLAVLTVAFSVTLALRLVPDVSLGVTSVSAMERAILVLLGTWLVVSISREVVELYGRPFVESTESDFDDRLLALVELTAALVISVIGVLLAVDALGVAITPFLASLGVAGLAVALAARTSLGNFFAGIVIALDRTIQPGHRLEVEGIQGEVVEIGRYKTTIRTYDNLLVGVPNERLMSEVVTNYDLPDALRRLDVGVGISYESDLDEATALLLEIAGGIDRVLPEPAPEVNVADLGPSSVDLQVLVWQGSPEGARRTRDTIHRQALRRFREAGIAIPYPQVDVGFRDGPPESPDEGVRG